MSFLFLSVAVILFGLCMGSFLNVCIYRLPAKQSIVSPPSHCYSCGETIRFYDNIPVLSYLILGGKCRYCKTPFSMRYLAVEVLTAAFAFAVFYRFGLSIQAYIVFFLICLLIVISMIDLDHQIIPNRITYPGIPVFFLLSFFFYNFPHIQILYLSLGGIVSGWLSLTLVNVCYKSLTGKDGMGGGDAKLLAMIGALTGWQGVFFTIFSSSLIGTVAGVGMMILQGKNMKLKIPFGPFLSLGALLYIFFGPVIIHWYMNRL